MKIPAILLATLALAQQDINSYEPPAASYQAPADYKTPLKCWHCDAVSFEECGSKGQEKTCLVSSQELCW